MVSIVGLTDGSMVQQRAQIESTRSLYASKSGRFAVIEATSGNSQLRSILMTSTSRLPVFEYGI